MGDLSMSQGESSALAPCAPRPGTPPGPCLTLLPPGMPAHHLCPTPVPVPCGPTSRLVPWNTPETVGVGVRVLGP